MEDLPKPSIKVLYKNIKHIILRVKPSLEVLLSVPFGTSEERIKEFLEQKKEWIKKRQSFFAEFQKSKAKDVIYYLGRAYPLRVIQDEQERVRLGHSSLEISLKDPSHQSRKEGLIRKWYRQVAQEQFSQILESYAKRLKLQVNRLKIRSMKTRWGSCNPKKGYINLNLELIAYPKEAIEYVILHELTHLLYFYHNQDFYAFLTLHMPDWKDREKLLRPTGF